MHLNSAGHEGAAVFAHVARSAQMHLDAVIFNWKQPKFIFSTKPWLLLTMYNISLILYAYIRSRFVDYNCVCQRVFQLSRNSLCQLCIIFYAEIIYPPFIQWVSLNKKGIDYLSISVLISILKFVKHRGPKNHEMLYDIVESWYHFIPYIDHSLFFERTKNKPKLVTPVYFACD